MFATCFYSTKNELAAELGIRDTTLFTDGQSACHILKKGLSNLFNDELVNRILYNCTYLEAEIQWIPSHIGIMYNEKADELAKKGTSSLNTLINKVRLKDVLRTFDYEMKNDGNTWYEKACNTKRKKFQRFQDKLPQKPWYHRCGIPARAIKKLNRLVAGHDHGNYWLSIMKIVPNGNCVCCNVPDMASHKVFHCSKYDMDRNKNPNIEEEKFIQYWKARDLDKIREIYNFIVENRMVI